MGMAVHVLLLTFIAYALSNPDRNPDCRKFVFAPICRGVAAKRSQPIKQTSNEFIFDANRLKELLKNFKMFSDWTEEEKASATKSASLSHQNLKQDPDDLLGFYEYDHK